MKRLAACVTVLMLLASISVFAHAQEEGKKKKDKATRSQKASLQEYTVIGVVESKEKKDKEGETRTTYSVKDENGVVFILSGKGKKTEKYGQYVGKKVKVVGEGVVLLKKITSVEEVK